MTDIVTNIRILTILLLIALIVILISRRLAVPYTLGLVIVGLIISFFTGFIQLRLTPDLVLFVFLPALLFEGAWSSSIQLFHKNWFVIFLLVGPGLLLELVLIATPLHFIAGLDWGNSFLLSAILSPTDPIAVLGLFRQLHVNSQLSAIIEGESLFNDGIAGSFYQVFLALVLASLSNSHLTGIQAWLQGFMVFLEQFGGGLLVGGISGFLVSRFVRHLDESLLETTVTIVAAYGTYLLAEAFHSSGILAVVIAGLIVGSYGRTQSMTEHTQETVDNFWSVIAFVANALLFLLVGVQLNPIHFLQSVNLSSLLITAGSTIVAVLLARLIVVLLLPRHLQRIPNLRLHSWRFLIFWSGLRGALSLALVLAVPFNVPRREELVFATYGVVLFTLLVQGLSLRLILKRLPGVKETSE